MGCISLIELSFSIIQCISLICTSTVDISTAVIIFRNPDPKLYHVKYTYIYDNSLIVFNPVNQRKLGLAGRNTCGLDSEYPLLENLKIVQTTRSSGLEPELEQILHPSKACDCKVAGKFLVFPRRLCLLCFYPVFRRYPHFVSFCRTKVGNYLILYCSEN